MFITARLLTKVWFLLKKKLKVMSLPYSGGIDKDTYLGVCEKLAVSSVNYLVARIVQLQRGCKFSKVDLLRSYKQFYIDPVNFPLMGFTCKGLFYFDCTLSMGSRSSDRYCQRVTSADLHKTKNNL